MSTNKINNDQIYREFQERVSRYVRGKIANSFDAEDVISEVFLKVYEKIESFDETKASLSTWIYHITHNTVIDYYRKHHTFSEVSEELPAEISVEDEVINEEMLGALAKALEQMDEKLRTLIIFHYYHGMKLSEVAERMSISYVYAKVLHKKALEALKLVL